MKPERLPSGSYRIRVYVGTVDGKPRYRSVTAKTRQAVQIAAAELMQDIRSGDPTSEDFTLRAAAEAYISSKERILSPSSIRGYKTILRANLPSLMPLRLSQITNDKIQRAINEEAATRSPKTVRNIYGLLTAVLKQYRPSFTPRVLLPQKKKTEIRIPTEEEVEAVLAACKGTDDEVAIILCALLGMRRSEIAALTWDKVDMKKNKIRIDRALVIGDGCERVTKGTKTTAGTRTVDMTPRVKRLLARQDRVDEKVCHLPLNSYVKHFKAIQKKVGIENPYRFHDLRHYFVSVCLYLGIPKIYIAGIVGHQTEKMIDAVYGHIMEDKKGEFSKTLSKYFS